MDLEDYKKENDIFKEKTSVCRNAETLHQFTNEIVQLKENLDHLEHKKMAFTGTSTIAETTKKGSRSNDTQRIGAECRFENGNANLTYKQQKSCSGRQHLDFRN